MRYLLFFVALLFGGCEVITDTNDIPYQDLMIVKGAIQDGLPVDSIYFAHTLPLNTAYTPQQAELSDVNATVSVDGKSYPLLYADSGLYTCPGLIGHAGKTYTLEADWHGKHVHAQTTVPMPPIIDSAGIVIGYIDTSIFEFDTSFKPDTLYYLYADLRLHLASNPGSVFSINYEAIDRIDSLQHDTLWYPGVIYVGSLDLRKDTAADGTLWINSFFETTAIDSFSQPEKEYKAIVHSYDPRYYDFFNTYNRYRDEDPSGIFSSGNGLNPDWNVTGDGFGLFIGISESEKIFWY